jgi:hypothetical protein
MQGLFAGSVCRLAANVFGNAALKVSQCPFATVESAMIVVGTMVFHAVYVFVSQEKMIGIPRPDIYVSMLCPFIDAKAFLAAHTLVSKTMFKGARSNHSNLHVTTFPPKRLHGRWFVPPE